MGTQIFSYRLKRLVQGVPMSTSARTRSGA